FDEVRLAPDVDLQLACWRELGIEVTQGHDEARGAACEIEGLVVEGDFEPRPLGKVFLFEAPSVHARAAHADDSALSGEAFQHDLDVVVSLGEDLAALGAAGRVANEEETQLEAGVFLEKVVREA